jgi:two-component system KDP operon response regulator KdpE
MDDLYVDVDCAESPIESPRGIERCIRTDSFLQEMVRDHGMVRLSKNEYRFLSVLVRSEGKTLTAGELMSNAFGSDHKRSSHYVRMYISLMRRRLEQDPRNPRHIITEHRRGYRFCR